MYRKEEEEARVSAYDVLTEMIGPVKVFQAQAVIRHVDASDGITVFDISFLFDKPLYVKLIEGTAARCIGVDPTGPWWHIGSWIETLLAFDSFYDQLKAYDGDIPTNGCLSLSSAAAISNISGRLQHG